MDMEDEYCDDCGGTCEGVHSMNETNTDEKEIQMLVNIILSKKEKFIDEVIKRITERKRLYK